SGNRFSNGTNGIILQSLSNLTISNGSLADSNVVISDTSGLTQTTTGRALYLSGVTGAMIDNVDVSKNSGTDGIGLYINGSTNITVTNVTANNRNQGLYANNLTGLSVSCTTLRNNATGMYVQNNSSTAVTLFDNYIGGNTTGLNNIATPIVITAENNYWGASNGPSNLGGSGDSYSGNVDASPFLTSLPACLYSDADLAMSKSVNATTLNPGSTITYTLTITNNGPDEAIGLTITDSIPISVTVSGVISSGASIIQSNASNVYTWTVDSLAANATSYITISGVLSASLPNGVFINTATITGGVIDTDESNNSDSAGVTVLGVPPVLVAISPISNTHVATVTSTVSITYDHNMDISSVSTQTFAVHAMETGLISQTYGVNGGRISLTPTNSFKPGELVQVSATTGTLDITGTNPLSPTVWQFRAQAGVGPAVFDAVTNNFGTGSDNTLSVAWGDVDGDGDLDAAVGNSNQQNVVALNQAPPPLMVAISPISNTHVATVTSTVSITYNHNMDISTVSTQTFAVHAMETGLISQTYGVNGGTI
ncbi:MAG: DUF11 domain-containing protein, partial [Chloroflexi bacterium]|nr:DUF11 domain-containing protein [Chloroflexota bacterium]